MAAPKDIFIEQWRGIAVLMVVLYHYTVRLPPEVFGASDAPLIQQSIGGIGVLFFQVISGFLIAKSMEASTNFGDFLARRISRLWPLFIVANIVIFCFLKVFDPPVLTTGPQPFYDEPRQFKDLIGSIFFAADLGFHWVDGVYWSLLVELKFYVLIGLCAVIAPKRFTTVFCTMALVFAIIDFMILYFDRTGPIGFRASENFRWLSKILHGILISQYLPLFAVGVALYRKKNDGLFTAIVLMGCISALIKVHEVQSFNIESAVMFLLLLGGFIAIDHAVFKSTIMSWVAGYSYAFFLFHQMIGLTLIKYMAPTVGLNVGILIALTIIGVLSVMASKLFEWRYRRPMTKALIDLFTLLRLNRLKIEVPKGA